MVAESKLVLILREGIEIVKVIFFKELRDHLRQQRPDRQGEWIKAVAAAVVNTVFGVENQAAEVVAFGQANRDDIVGILHTVGTELASLRIPLTDALRTMVLCDHQEGLDSSSLLKQAQELGILLVERELPLPNHFIDLVRRLGRAKGILQGGDEVGKA